MGNTNNIGGDAGIRVAQMLRIPFFSISFADSGTMFSPGNDSAPKSLLDPSCNRHASHMLDSFFFLYEGLLKDSMNQILILVQESLVLA